uniref:Remorin C-terminal domain-containing protein n=1 Tax=Kalanchoe fedtschenkoi TaxID=63787 RepID=A0A7N0U1T7_KALFE
MKAFFYIQDEAGEDHREVMKIEEVTEPQTPIAMTGEEKARKDDSPEEKSVVPFRGKDQDQIINKKVHDSRRESFSNGFIDGDTQMAKVGTEKRMALIKAWEDNEKAKAENRAYKKMTLVGSWEERKKAILELRLKKIEEKLEETKAGHREEKKNKVAELHKAAEERRAAIEAQCGRNVVEIAGRADRFRATGRVPKKFARCFSAISC